ncbi:MAG: endonuclease, partial [Bacteroidota bacterium]
TWTPGSADIGMGVEVVIRAADAQTFALTSAMLDVIAEGGNSAPRFTEFMRGAKADVGVTQTLDFRAEDDQEDDLTFSIVEGPPTATLEATGDGAARLTYTPTAVGVERFVIRVTDGAAGSFDEVVVGMAGVVPPAGAGLFPELAGAELRHAVDAAYSPTRTLGYTDGRDTLYARVETLSGSLASSAALRFVRGVYTNFAVQLAPREDPSAYLFDGGLNAEHLWPQSLGAADEPQRSDMHILYPSRVSVNSDRGNLPFGTVSEGEVRRWYNGGSIQSAAPTTGSLSGWSRLGDARFEPNDGVKGDVARALFYFWTMYPDAADQAFFEEQIETLLDWNEQDPPSSQEMGRSARIQYYQGNPNPFVLETSLMDRMWNQATRTEEAQPGALRLSVYPNPAAQGAVVALQLDAAVAYLRVEVFDLLGRRVHEVRHPALAAGRHRVPLQVADLASGLYIIRVGAGNQQRTARLHVMR